MCSNTACDGKMQSNIKCIHYNLCEENFQKGFSINNYQVFYLLSNTLGSKSTFCFISVGNECVQFKRRYVCVCVREWQKEGKKYLYNLFVEWTESNFHIFHHFGCTWCAWQRDCMSTSQIIYIHMVLIFIKHLKLSAHFI